MKEFVVEITVTVPDGTDPAELDRRRAAEAARVKELAADGHVSRMWRPEGEPQPRSIGIWSADTEAELQQKMLQTLPLYPWFSSLVVTPLVPHPNDPHKAGNA
jgi:muconolactone D-isomerase